VIFFVAALTDFIDGRIARKYNLVTEFGKRFDVVADRFLWGGTALAFLISFGINGDLDRLGAIQIILIMSKEIITAAFVLPAFFLRKRIPRPKIIGKVTNWFQAFALPLLILSYEYEKLIYASFPLAIACCIVGTKAGVAFLVDLYRENKK
jgi:CDP-diacylglycerol--glycerol-3-phosphate 3-phosphatidyltransferase